MKKSILIILAIICFSCEKKSIPLGISGTWKMVYAEIIENDSIKIKDLKHTEFIKIINDSHFAFFNQNTNNTENFYGGGGTYILNGNDYEEILSYTSSENIKNHKFSFKIQIKGDTLIQSGIERIKAAGINRAITEKYIKLN
ncbi:hypothetical protein [Formosa sp. PL04]|uniref:hypothetical protein n=1 Tax=Formosa sp. PL04 TaxID=3081755 RepID=UPI0029821D6F|nr:hypothetical protein [Formosa sp. PL04]MDW5290007.1 hypothetical protein [Formosa sp. PL04]